MIEFEKKALLTAEEYAFIKKHCYPACEAMTQTNYYYDTDDFELNRQGITCRIREKCGGFVATIKDHQSDGCSIETSKNATGRYDTSFFEGMGIDFQGSLTTVRATFVTCDGIFVMLDENRYLDTTDYEIEYEYQAGQYEIVFYEIKELAEMLKHHNLIESTEDFITRFENGLSKSCRFYQRKVELAES